jgi:hypothetical protein
VQCCAVGSIMSSPYKYNSPTSVGKLNIFVRQQNNARFSGVNVRLMMLFTITKLSGKTSCDKLECPHLISKPRL